MHVHQIEQFRRQVINWLQVRLSSGEALHAVDEWHISELTGTPEWFFEASLRISTVPGPWSPCAQLAGFINVWADAESIQLTAYRPGDIQGGVDDQGQLFSVDWPDALALQQALDGLADWLVEHLPVRARQRFSKSREGLPWQADSFPQPPCVPAN